MATQDPFASIGGGVQLPDGGWVPKNHPAAQQHLQNNPTADGSAPATGANTIPGQAAAASTYSATPGAAPNPYMTNQGTQDVVRNSYLEQAVQPTTVDKTAPEYRQQADTFSANTERARRDYLADVAEKTSGNATGALRGEARMASERAGLMNAQFESELVGRELQNIRMEKKEALAALGEFLTNDQKAQLERDIADLEAQLRREGYSVETNIANSKLAQDDRHWAGDSALKWSQFDWTTNPMNPANWPD